jgi:hypothetical protein
MNAIMECWIQSCQRELLDRTLIWNQRHLLEALREYDTFYNGHRALGHAAPLRPLPEQVTEPGQISFLTGRAVSGCGLGRETGIAQEVTGQ